MSVGLRVFSVLVLLTAHSQASHEKKNSTEASAVPEEPKLPVPWQKLAARVTPHHKKKAAAVHNRTNKSHPVQQKERVHSTEDEAKLAVKLQADTEGVVVQPLPEDVAAKMDMKLAVGTKAKTPAHEEVAQRETPSKPLNSTVDAMDKLHHEAEQKLHKGKKQHDHTKEKQNKTSSNPKHLAKKKKQPTHTDGVANFEKLMGVNSSATNHTDPRTKNVSATTSSKNSKKAHKGKHHKKKVQTETAPKPSVNVTGDVMSALHHEVAHDDAKPKPEPHHTTTTTSTTTTTQASFTKGLKHLRADMYMGHQKSLAANPGHVQMSSNTAWAIHSSLSVGKKHHKKTPENIFAVREIPADPMAAIHKEAQKFRAAEKPKEKPAAKAEPKSLRAEDLVTHSGGLARMENDLDVNTTHEVDTEPKKVEPAASQEKHSSSGAKHHNKKSKASVPPAPKVAPTQAVDKDPILSLHKELHPEDKRSLEVEVAPTVKPQANPQVSKAPKIKVHESRRNSLRKLREDLHR